ncbi:MAG TPA: hypothetical protein PKA06_00150, partial [Gemmatales bacterium]|nr:hypothetical protein [Gemmatales bacterium]
MRRWYHILATLVFAPSVLFAQGTGFSGTGTATGGTNLGGTGTAQGAGLAGQANTTLLGNTVNLNFLPVFGTSATIANTNPDPFAAYRPTGSGTGSTVAGGAGSTIGNAFAGGGMNTGTVAPAGGANLGGNNLNRAGTNLGTFGGGLTGGLGGMNRNMMGGGFLGGGMGMGMNNQQGMINMGYRVNYEGQSVNKITPNAS